MQEDGLRALVAVAEHRHLRRAAAALYVVPSTLGRRLSGLERDVGLVLVDRTAGAVRLTAAGERFMPSAQRVLEALAAAGQDARLIAQSTPRRRHGCDPARALPASTGGDARAATA